MRLFTLLGIIIFNFGFLDCYSQNYSNRQNELNSILMTETRNPDVKFISNYVIKVSLGTNGQNDIYDLRDVTFVEQKYTVKGINYYALQPKCKNNGKCIRFLYDERKYGGGYSDEMIREAFWRFSFTSREKLNRFLSLVKTFSK